MIALLDNCHRDNTIDNDHNNTVNNDKIDSNDKNQ